MENFRQTYAVIYSDEGPNGACGQDCLTCSDHTRVYLFDKNEDMVQWLKDNYEKTPDRKKSKVTCCYPKGSENYSYANGLEWPRKAKLNDVVYDRPECMFKYCPCLADCKKLNCCQYPLR